MKPGARVTTNKGPGTLTRYLIDRAWAYNRPNVITWAAVKLDHTDQIILLLPSQLQEAPMPMTEPEPTPTQPDEPAPDPDPQPEPDTEDEDSKATRRTITIQDEELVGQANPIEWP